MDRSIEDPHIARTIAEQIDQEEGEFEHYATVKADDKSGPDDFDYKWRTFHIGAREGALYVAERSSQVEGVHVHNAEDIEAVLEEIAAKVSHYWENASVDTSPHFEDRLGVEFERPDLFRNAA